MSQTPEAIYHQVRGFLDNQKAAQESADPSPAAKAFPAGEALQPANPFRPGEALPAAEASHDQDECNKPCPAAHALWMQDHIDSTPDRTYHDLKV